MNTLQPVPLPPGGAVPGSDDRLTRFVDDQLEAAKIARAERHEPIRQKVDAVYMAMQYLDLFQAGQAQTAAKVIETARVFEQYLTES